MSAEHLSTYAQALLASVTINVIVPLFILVVMMFSVWRLVVYAQRKPDFNIERMFLDDDGKPSAARFIMLLAFAFSCWYLAVRVLSGNPDPTEFYAFLAAWASSLTLLKAAEKWNGALPFAKSTNPTEQQQ